MEKMFAPHYESTLSRLADEQVILTVQDTTSLNYSTPREDLGLMSTAKTAALACLTIDMVVAWRIFHLTKLGRETPGVPCTIFFRRCSMEGPRWLSKAKSEPSGTAASTRRSCAHGRHSRWISW